MTEYNTNIYHSNEISSCREGNECLYSDNLSSYNAKKYESETLPSHEEQSERETSVSSDFVKRKCKPDVPQKSDGTKMICKFFLRNACTKGDSCSFSHVIRLLPKSIADDSDALDSTLDGKKMICKFLLLNTYSKGDSYSFSDVIPSPPKSVGDDSNKLDSARNKRFWRRDKNFKRQLSKIIHAQPDFSTGTPFFPHPSPVSMSEKGQKTNVGSFSTPSNVRMTQLNTGLSNQHDSNSATVSDSDFSNRSNSFLTLTNICMPHMDSINVSGMAFADHLSFAPISGDIPLSHADSFLIPKEGIYNHSVKSLNPEVVVIPHFATAPETADWNLSYSSSYPGVYGPHLAPPMAIEAFSPHSYSSSKWEVTYMSHLDSTEPAFSNISLSTSDSGILHTPHVYIPTISEVTLNHSYPTSNPEIVSTSLLDSATTAEAVHTNHSYSKQEIDRMPHFDSTANSESAKLNYLPSIKNAEETPEYKKCLIDSGVLEQDNLILESLMLETQTTKLCEGAICEICDKNVSEKESSNEYKFGILLNCNHTFCLPCIKQSRIQSKKRLGLNYTDARSCPKCLKPFDYIVPSKYWTDSKEQKNKLAAKFLNSLKKIHCSYFFSGSCRFGNNCRYLHDYSRRENYIKSRSSRTSDYYSDTASISADSSDTGSISADSSDTGSISAESSDTE